MYRLIRTNDSAAFTDSLNDAVEDGYRLIKFEAVGTANYAVLIALVHKED